MIGVKSFAVMARCPAPPEIAASAFQVSAPANRSAAVAASMSMSFRIDFLLVFIDQTRESFHPPGGKGEAVECRRRVRDRQRLARSDNRTKVSRCGIQFREPLDSPGVFRIVDFPQNPSFVMAGPHRRCVTRPSMMPLGSRRRYMDCRVKPGNDDLAFIS
jgi:hypothetical protein